LQPLGSLALIPCRRPSGNRIAAQTGAAGWSIHTAGALNNVSQQLGSALGVALISTFVATATSGVGDVDDDLASPRVPVLTDDRHGAVEQHGEDDDDAGRGGAPRSGRGPLPSTLARATSLTASRSRCNRRASLSRIARKDRSVNSRRRASEMMCHGTDEACVPGHRAMDGRVIERVAGAMPGPVLP
jgi:hypothetical protein